MTEALAAGFIKVFTGVTPRWQGCAPEMRQRIYYANHTSHLDAPVIWAVLPPPIRRSTRMVAARDYWLATALRRYMAEEIFHAVLIERKNPSREDNPIEAMLEAIGTEGSLIIFPEGTRSTSPEPGAFKGGLFHLARRRPAIEFVPVLIDNLNRILPKGEYLPVPFVGSVTFGTPILFQPGEEKVVFLERARKAILDLRQR